MGAIALAIFEVMDKEPSLLALAVFYISTCILAYFGSRQRWWIALLVLPLIVLCNNIPEVRDPYVGPAILKEAGPTYEVFSYAMLFGALTFPIVVAVRQRIAHNQLKAKS